MADKGRTVQLGADEAGRGPVMGPMVLCALAGEPEELAAIGVRDSKKLSPSRRNELFEQLHYVSKWEIHVVWPQEIDNAVNMSALNMLELTHFAQLLSLFDCPGAYVDAPDVDERRFSLEVSKLCGKLVVAEHRADERYPSVSAASIIAKVTRDRLIDGLKTELGSDFGSGYASDRKTVLFIEEYVARCGVLPPYCRHSWETSRRILANSKIKNLEYFR
ncbi:MAG: ribonuclease HII [Thermoplasmata archaeon]|nr:ribonuclease HII [Candidatus Sysuiplasma acidicola]MBX8646194.1 ribonuclease HII [Candidatus Sysuiplasma acidicola]